MILEEAFNAADMHPKGKHPCELFLGRMQPIHNGHAAIINKMKNPVVAIVKGEKSSADKGKNPLTFEYQRDLLKKVAPKAKVIAASSGYIPEIVDHLRQQNESLEPSVVYAGADRIAGYKAQIERANKTLDEDKQIHVTFKETERVTSATTVREAIRSGDEKEFQKNTPRAIWSEFSKLKTLLQESDMHNINTKSFQEFLEGLNEEADANTTDGVAGKDMPLKKKDEEDDDDEDDDEGKDS